MPFQNTKKKKKKKKRWYLLLYTYHLVNTSAGWLLVLDSIMLSLVSILALTCFIRYICIAIHIIIIIKSKVLLLQTCVTVANFGYSLYAIWLYLLQKEKVDIIIFFFFFFFCNLFIFPRTDLYIHDSINIMFQCTKVTM
jgi:hypothetical protein